MLWEPLTSDEFAAAVRETGVCVISMGVVERHDTYIPLGTDYLSGHAVTCLAAEKEAAIVFPPFDFGQIHEARCFSGTITLKPTSLLELVTSVLDEIGRNGFKKVILFNAHSGNDLFLPFLAQCTLWEQKSYSVYLYTGAFSPECQKEWDAIRESDEHRHACECETSILIASYPELVDLGKVLPQPRKVLKRLAHLPAHFSGIWWYADYPEHYAGDARTASIEKGLRLRQIKVEALAEYIQAVKADQVMPALEQEFFERERKLRQDNAQAIRRLRLIRYYLAEIYGMGDRWKVSTGWTSTSS